ncbi:MAG: effector-associated domain EAD1-containing protein [Zavarzinella sp.]
MTGRQIEALRDALCSAFDQDSLDQMLCFRLDKDRERLVGSGPRQAVVFKVINVAVREGWLAQLLHAAKSCNPGNFDLRKFCEEHPELIGEGGAAYCSSGRAPATQDGSVDNFVPLSIGSSFEPFFSRGPGDNADWALVIRILNSGQRDVTVCRAVYFLDPQDLVPIIPDAKRSQVHSTGFEVKFGEQWKLFECSLKPGAETITYVPLRAKATAVELPHGRRGELLLDYLLDGRAAQHRAAL